MHPKRLLITEHSLIERELSRDMSVLGCGFHSKKELSRHSFKYSQL
jgi:hypothetical protein